MAFSSQPSLSKSTFWQGIGYRRIVLFGLLFVLVIGGGFFGLRKAGVFADTLPDGSDFTDVPLSSPNYWFIHAMKVNGITEGCSATSYCPQTPITNEQLAIFLQRVMNTEISAFNPSDNKTWAANFADIQGRSSWVSIQALVDGLTNGSLNSLKNSGFEDWTAASAPDNWIPAGATLTKDSTISKEGTASLKIVGNGASQSGAQYKVGILSPGNYFLTTWIKVSSGQAGITINGVGNATTGVTDWRRLGFSFNLTEQKDITIGIGVGGTSSANFDKIKLYKTDYASCGSNNFCPTAIVKREGMAAVLATVLGLDQSAFKKDDTTTWAAEYTDVPLDATYWPHIQAVTDAGITGGCSENPLKFCPTDVVTREQMAIFLVRAFGLPLYKAPVVNGKLTKMDGQVLSDAVIMFDEDYVAVTNANGDYKLDENMPPGTYELEIIKDGIIYIPDVRSGLVEIVEGNNTLQLGGLRPLQDTDLQG